MENSLSIFSFMFIIIVPFLCGFISAVLYYGFYNPNGSLQGVYVKNSTEPQFPYGDWVCSNVVGMDFDRCVEVAVHECAHELFAEECENNPAICFELSEQIKKNLTEQK